MKICKNNEVREMTVSEIAAMQAAGLPSTPEPLTADQKLALLLESIPEEPMPTMEPKLGYRWQPIYTPGSGFAWELVEDPAALGTAKNPWYWAEGMAVRLGHHYTVDGQRTYLAVADGVPPAWADTDWFEEVSG